MPRLPVLLLLVTAGARAFTTGYRGTQHLPDRTCESTNNGIVPTGWTQPSNYARCYSDASQSAAPTTPCGEKRMLFGRGGSIDMHFEVDLSAAPEVAGFLGIYSTNGIDQVKAYVEVLDSSRTSLASIDTGWFTGNTWTEFELQGLDISSGNASYVRYHLACERGSGTSGRCNGGFDNLWGYTDSSTCTSPTCAEIGATAPVMTCGTLDSTAPCDACTGDETLDTLCTACECPALPACNSVSPGYCDTLSNSCDSFDCGLTACLAGEDCNSNRCTCSAAAQSCSTSPANNVQCGSISIACTTPSTKNCGNPCNSDQSCQGNVCRCDSGQCLAGEQCNSANLACECTSAAQLCSTNPANNRECGTVSIACTTPTSKNCGNVCNSDQTCTNNLCTCNPSACRADEACDGSTASCECVRQCATSPENNRECGNVPVDCDAGLTISCGNPCRADESCVSNTCQCDAVLPSVCNGDKCGVISNACGNSQNCDVLNSNPCDQFQVCRNNICECTAGSCPASQDRSCSPNGNQTCLCDEVPASECVGKCGVITNACGNTRDCGGCLTTDESCVNNVCECATLTCGPNSCGTKVNSCSSLSCPNTCVAPDTCISNECTCVLQNCSLLGKDCGSHVSCFQPVVCGTASGACINGWPCSTDGNCIDPNCSPFTSCAAESLSCGILWTGCVNATCGVCQGGQLCQGGACVCPQPDPSFCANNGFDCGDASDGCNTITCGPATCPLSFQACYQNRCTNQSLIPPPPAPPTAPASDEDAETTGDAGAVVGIVVGVVAAVLCCAVLVVGAVVFVRKKQQDSEELDTTDEAADRSAGRGGLLAKMKMKIGGGGGGGGKGAGGGGSNAVPMEEGEGASQSGTPEVMVYGKLGDVGDESPDVMVYDAVPKSKSKSSSKSQSPKHDSNAIVYADIGGFKSQSPKHDSNSVVYADLGNFRADDDSDSGPASGDDDEPYQPQKTEGSKTPTYADLSEFREDEDEGEKEDEEEDAPRASQAAAAAPAVPKRSPVLPKQTPAPKFGGAPVPKQQGRAGPPPAVPKRSPAPKSSGAPVPKPPPRPKRPPM